MSVDETRQMSTIATWFFPISIMYVWLSSKADICPGSAADICLLSQQQTPVPSQHQTSVLSEQQTSRVLQE